MDEIKKPAGSDLTKADNTVYGVLVQRDKGHGTLKDYVGSNNVTVAWDLNEAAQRDGIFKLIMNGKEAYLNAEELKRLLRWV